MSSNPITTDVKPQMLIKSTLYKTKKFFNKSFTNLKFFIPNSHEKPPETPIFSSSNVISSKMQELGDFYTSFSEKCGANSVEVVKKKDGNVSSQNVEQTRDEQQCSKSSITNSDCSGLEEMKEVRKPRKCSGRKQEKPSFVAAEVLAQKMKDLEMMDLNDMDHALDVEEVLHYYSRLTCPVYVEIVDKFFMDMYSQFHTPQPSGSLNNSMRRSELTSVHSSMRSLGPLKL
ncbi:LOW protein: ATP-dependent RNA helicase-like protein [Perilla frutescens var. hirtella]|nr:LOW protein: ATP-dependent RNA helicase-like protein [Perilla frutescens var. hirtella]